MQIAFGLGPYGENRRYARSELATRGAILSLTPTDLTAYFVYLSWCAELVTIARVGFVITTLSTSGTAEVGIFTTPNPPTYNTGQTLTKIVSGTTDSITAVNSVIKRNASAFATALTSPAHIWAGLRVDQAGAANAVVRGLGESWTSGQLLQLAASGTFAATSTYAGTVPAFSLATAEGPDLFASLTS